MIFKDQELIAEAYSNIIEKRKKKCKCDCKTCKCNELKEGKKSKKPDYLDVDKDGNKKEPMKKALKDKKHIKEGILSFKDIYNQYLE